jgi:hypothetical protein
MCRGEPIGGGRHSGYFGLNSVLLQIFIWRIYIAKWGKSSTAEESSWLAGLPAVPCR